MKKDKNYSWWTDPKNKKEVDKISWWNHPKNQVFINFPIALINDGKYWVASTRTDKSGKFLGEDLTGVSQGKTRKEAIEKLFLMIRYAHSYSEDCRLSYQRWVPFRKDSWGKIGGNWFSIFGFHIYFRYGKGNKEGWFVPFTKLNISFSSDWTVYKRYKEKKNGKQLRNN